MKKTLIIFIIFCCLASPLFAKANLAKITFKRDSIESTLPSLPDSLKITALLKMAELYMNYQPQQGIIYCFRARDLLGNNKIAFYEYKIQETLLNIYSRLNINDKMTATIQEMIAIKEPSNDPLLVARLRRTLAGFYHNADKTDEAISELQKSMQIINSLKVDCLSGYYIAGCLRDLGNINRDLEKYDLAIKFYDRSDSVCYIFVNNPGNKLSTYLSKYNNGKRTDKNLWEIMIASNLNDLGDSYEMSNRYKEAETFYLKSLKQTIKNQTPSGLRIAYLNLASVNRKMGNFSKALDYQLKSIGISKKHNLYYYQLLDNIYLLSIYSAMRDNARSSKVIRSLEDQMSKFDMSQILTEVQARYELEKREKQNEIKKLELSRQRNILFIFLLITLILFLVVTGFVGYKFKANKVNKLKLEQGKTKAELLALQGKINPHFLFNSLNSLASLIDSNSPHAAKMLQNLSRLLRYTLQSSQKAVVPLSDELKIVNTYLEIELLRLADRLVYEIDCPQEFTSILIPPLIIQPLVENSIKHAISKMIDGGKVVIICRKENNHLKITIKDNGESQNISTNPASGFGLDYIRDILQLTYGKSNLMQIRQTDGFEVILLIPLSSDIQKD